jgi:NCAIR mutase (PurE)-related protein
MNHSMLHELLQRVASGDIDPQEALERIRFAPYESLDHGVTLDTSRALRTGQPETIFGQGKSLRQIRQAVSALAHAGQPSLGTRIGEDMGRKLADEFPQANYDATSRLFCLGRDLNLDAPSCDTPDVLVLSAGAADYPVALETLGTCRFFGLHTGLGSDAGAAGLHRLIPHQSALSKARLVIAVAGMDGVLPTVVAGMCGKPVIAVPTSVGYGTGLGGVAALMAMLNSCAPGVCVVNIDNGYGAAALAAKILDNTTPTRPDGHSEPPA